MRKTSTIFWDVDTQNDFIKKDGKLAIPGAEAILGNLERLTQYARQAAIQIVASVDDHTLGDEEISAEPDFMSTYPPHCLHGTGGQEKVRETRPVNPLYIDLVAEDQETLRRKITSHVGEIIIRKNRFDVFLNPNTEKVLAVLNPEHVIVYGVALDVCNRYAIEGLIRNGRAEIALVEDASKAIDEAKRPQLLNDWRSRGVRIITTEEVLQGCAFPAAPRRH
ncbi:MAG: cysteine hydrolase [Acidobacteria bacterium]|nr:cysteine hydrolase [Acidobacteriota bacterium]